MIDLNKPPWPRIRIADCWEYDGYHQPGGYAQSGRGLVHREVYELLVGPIEGELDHLCKNTGCCNPDHLEPVTSIENIRRSEVGKYRRTVENNRNMSKTSCPQGHPYDKVRDGKRRCRTCDIEADRRYRSRRNHD